MDSSKIFYYKSLKGIALATYIQLNSMDMSNTEIIGVSGIFTSDLTNSVFPMSTLPYALSMGYCTGENITFLTDNFSFNGSNNTFKGSNFISGANTRLFGEVSVSDFSGSKFNINSYINGNDPYPYVIVQTGIINNCKLNDCEFNNLRLNLPSGVPQIENCSLDFSIFNQCSIIATFGGEIVGTTFNNCKFNETSLNLHQDDFYDFTNSNFNMCELTGFVADPIPGGGKLIENCIFNNCTNVTAQGLINGAYRFAGRSYTFRYNGIVYTVPAA
jgi:hypothetical protein